MKATGLSILGIVIVLIVIAISMFVGVYNRLQIMDENVTAAMGSGRKPA